MQGTYSYVDANGVLQTVNYVSDAEGFKVAATNLPKAPLPEAAASAPAPAPYVAPVPTVEDQDDIEVISEEQESVANTVPLALSPAYYYAPHQGYYQPPVTPAVVQAPVQAPVAYYAPHHGYTAPVVTPEVTPVAAPTHSQFHAQVINSSLFHKYAKFQC